MQIRNNVMLVLVLSMICGCATMEHAWRVAFITAHESIDDALQDTNTTEGVSTLLSKTNVAPASSRACSCDLSKPLATPLVPKHGASDAEVDAWLRQRWVDGIADNCGGLPGDVRPQLWRPLHGKCFNYKYVAQQKDGTGIQIRINGEKMTIIDGNFEGQSFHLIGTSAHEAPNNGAHPSTLEDWVPAKSGMETTKRQFPYFEIRDL